MLKDWASTSFANAGLGCGATESQLLPMSFRAGEEAQQGQHCRGFRPALQRRGKAMHRQTLGRMQAAVNTVWSTGPSTMSNGRPCQLQSGASSVTPRPVFLL